MSLQAVFIHDNTPTSRKARVLEERLTRELNTIVRKIRDNINPLNPVNELETKFKPLYEQQVYDLIRVTAQETYIAGTTYVNNLPIFKNMQTYLIIDDIQYIQDIAEEYNSRFWGRVAITADRGDNIFGTKITIDKELGIVDPKYTFLNPKYISKQISTGLIYTTLNQATVRRIRHNVENTNPLNLNVQLPKVTQGAIQDVLILSSLVNTLASVKLVWTTSMDERVDPLCRDLEGKKYTIYDQSLPIPPIHPGCRCRITVSK